jgi:hypothetical protein
MTTKRIFTNRLKDRMYNDKTYNVTKRLQTKRLQRVKCSILNQGPVELLHVSHFHHVSLVQWTNCLLPATRGQWFA